MYGLFLSTASAQVSSLHHWVVVIISPWPWPRKLRELERRGNCGPGNVEGSCPRPGTIKLCLPSWKIQVVVHLIIIIIIIIVIIINNGPFSSLSPTINHHHHQHLMYHPLNHQAQAPAPPHKECSTAAISVLATARANHPQWRQSEAPPGSRDDEKKYLMVQHQSSKIKITRIHMFVSSNIA